MRLPGRRRNIGSVIERRCFAHFRHPGRGTIERRLAAFPRRRTTDYSGWNHARRDRRHGRRQHHDAARAGRRVCRICQRRLMATSDGAPVERVLKASTAETVRAMLEGAVSSERATGKAAAVTGVRVGGKTGTSDDPDCASCVRGSGSFMSFVGIVPIDAHASSSTSGWANRTRKALVVPSPPPRSAAWRAAR
jgi:Penicillin binding protein transpeptidase domain